MTYFCNEQPLSFLERLMQQPPLFRLPGRGRGRFRYRKEDCDCSLCAIRPCPGMVHCPCFDEYLEAGAWGYGQLLRKMSQDYHPGPLLNRLTGLYCQPDLLPWASPEHRQRFLTLRRQGFLPLDASTAYQGAAFLLCADSGLWDRCTFQLDGYKINFPHISPAGLDESGYILFQAARGLYYSQRRISEDELADPRIIDDELFALIMAAFVIRAYGLSAVGEPGSLH